MDVYCHWTDVCCYRMDVYCHRTDVCFLRHVRSVCAALDRHCAMLDAYVPHWLCHIIVCLSPPFLLPVRERITTSEDGESIIEQDLVKAAPLIKSPGYNLLNDDPGAYSDGEDFDGFCPDREWPNEGLASQPAPVPTL